jgi:two-component system sensor histidine kinase RegB
MGLGLFIARTLLERSGARLSFANGSDALARGARRPADDPEGARPTGAVIEIAWPPGAIDVPKTVARAALGPNARFEAAG